VCVSVSSILTYCSGNVFNIVISVTARESPADILLALVSLAQDVIDAYDVGVCTVLFG